MSSGSLLSEGGEINCDGLTFAWKAREKIAIPDTLIHPVRAPCSDFEGPFLFRPVDWST
jgi:hypothetical protein